jgi:type I restriction enzyme, S subunit
MINRMSPTVALNKIAKPILRPIDVITGTLYRTIGVRWWGEGAYERESIDGSQTVAKTLSVVREGDLIINKIWVRHGSIAIVGKEVDGCAASGEFPTFELDTSQIFPRWLYWFIKSPSFWEKCAQLSQGTSGKNRIKPELFLTIEIPLPPLDEQWRIVARLEELTAKVEEARGLRGQSAEEAKKLYSAFLSSIMEPHGEAWKQETVADVMINIDAGWSPMCHDFPAKIGEWGVLKTTSVQWCEFHPNENKALPLSLIPRPELTIHEGDVLVTRAGPRKRVGVVAAIRKTEPLLTISDKLIRIRPDNSKIDYRFLELSLASPFSQQHLVQRKTGLADAQVNISQAILRATPIAYPSLSEQRRIVAYLDNLQAKVDALKRLQAETAAELDALLPSILDKAFKGEL